MAKKLDAFTRSYIECALWSETDNATESGGSPLDQNYNVDNIDPDALQSMVNDCEKFQAEHGDAIDAAPAVSRSGEHTNREMAGHDFWLTRNGHGAGFWDGDWPAELGTSLTEASKAFGECSLYVGDDGQLYLSEG